MIGAPVDRLVRRYEPLVVTAGVVALIVQLVAPLPRGISGLPSLAPFRAGSHAAAPARSASSAPPPSLAVGVAPAAVVPPSSSPSRVTADRPPADAGPDVRVLARLSEPGGTGGLAATDDGSVVAVLAGPHGALAVLGPDGSPRRAIDVGAGDLTGVVTDGDTAFVLDGQGVIHRVPLEGGRVESFATIPDVPPCVPVVRPTACDASPVDAKPRPVAAVVAPGGGLLVADEAQGAVWRVGREGGTATQLVVDTSWARPDRAAGPVGLALDGAGNVVIAVGGTLTDDAGRIVLQAIGPDGTAGAHETLATLGPGELPGGLALGSSGRVYVTLPGQNAVVVLEPDGRMSGRKQVGDDLDAGPLGAAVVVGDALLAAGRTALLRITFEGGPR